MLLPPIDYHLRPDAQPPGDPLKHTRRVCVPTQLRAVMQEIARLRPRRLAYVSCDLRSLGRDLKALAEAGYRVGKARAIDMFPHTCHVESLVCLERAR